jgi:hypothetical protein
MKSGRLPRKHKKALMTGRYFKQPNHIDWYPLFSIQQKEYLQSLLKKKKRYSIGIVKYPIMPILTQP